MERVIVWPVWNLRLGLVDLGRGWMNRDGGKGGLTEGLEGEWEGKGRA